MEDIVSRNGNIIFDIKDIFDVVLLDFLLNNSSIPSIIHTPQHPPPRVRYAALKRNSLCMQTDRDKIELGLLHCLFVDVTPAGCFLPARLRALLLARAFCCLKQQTRGSVVELFCNVCAIVVHVHDRHSSSTARTSKTWIQLPAVETEVNQSAIADYRGGPRTTVTQSDVSGRPL